MVLGFPVLCVSDRIAAGVVAGHGNSFNDYYGMVYKIIRMECQREYEVPMCRMYLIIQGIEIMEYEPYQAKSVNSHDHT